MTGIFSPCRKYREDLCDAMIGDLPAGKRAALERHLQACPDCQKYRDEIGNVTALLSSGGELFPDIGPNEITRMRWAKEFKMADNPAYSTSKGFFRAFLDWSGDLVWPCRRIWAGIAAVWIVILVLNAGQRAKEEAQASSRPSPEFIRALLACEGFLPGVAHVEEDRKTESQSSPSHQQRSEPKHGNKSS